MYLCSYLSVTHEQLKFITPKKESPRPGAEDFSLYIFSPAPRFFFSHPSCFSFGKAMLHGIVWFVYNLQVLPFFFSVTYMCSVTYTDLLVHCTDALCLVLFTVKVQFLKGQKVLSHTVNSHQQKDTRCLLHLVTTASRCAKLYPSVAA